MRLMLKRPLSDTWLDLDAPVISSPSVTPALSAPGDISFSLPVEYNGRKGEDGLPVLAKWHTLVVAVDDGGRAYAGLVDDISLKEDRVDVSAGGLSMQSKDLPWTRAKVEYFETDPIDIIHDVWGHINRYGNHVALELTGATSSPGRVGKSESHDHRRWRVALEGREARVKTLEASLVKAESRLAWATKELFKACGMSTVGEVRYSTGGGSSTTTNVVWVDSDDNNRAHVYKYFPAGNVRDPSTKRLVWKPSRHEWVAVYGVQSKANTYASSRVNRDKLKDDLSKAKQSASAASQELRKYDEGAPDPYVMAWHETRDLSSVMDDMGNAGPVEWLEWAELDESTGKLRVGLELGSPRIGARRDGLDDPRFELGVNIHEHPIVEDAEPYTDVKVYGAGEGSATLHEYRSFGPPGRVRRVHTVVDKDAKTRAQVRRIADAEAQRLSRQQAVNITELVVEDHPYARPGTYGVGDDIYVAGEMSDGTDLNVWVRIQELTRTSDGRTELKVVTT